MESTAPPGRLAYAVVFVLLLALTATTYGVAWMDLGVLNTPAAIAIAIVKASLVVLYFMHVRHASAVTRLFAIAGFFWLGILLTLTIADYATR